MSDFLRRMARGAARRGELLRHVPGEAALLRAALDAPAPPLRLRPGGFDCIAEFKRRSPAEGALAAPGENPARRVRAYAAGGAAMVSVLTEPEEFGGSLSDLEAAASAVRVPVMRKDFLVDPLQVLESRAAGAAGVLVILRIVEDARLDEMIDAAARIGLFLLLEIFDEADLPRAHRAAEKGRTAGLEMLVGVNARNLESLAIEPGRSGRFRPRLPAGFPAVAESGLSRPDEAARVAREGYRLALVGSALMRATDPAGLVAAMIGAGRSALEEPSCASS
jgi:indole-3-glycerol phosphate synthase